MERSLSPAIELIPEVPPGLIEASGRGVLVPFVGAGVSLLAGCPRWARFADGALEQLVEEKLLSPAEMSQMSTLQPRVKLSIAQVTAKKNGIDLDYAKLLHGSADWHANKDGRAAYGHLSALSSCFVTTNYDRWLDLIMPGLDMGESNEDEDDDRKEELKRNVIHRSEDIRPEALRSDTVVHLHGSLENPEGMILSTKDYLQHYLNDRHRVGGDGENTILRFLEFLFENRTVLFVGYGLEELEILEYVIMKAQSSHRRGDKVARHYILQGFFSFEKPLCDALREYFLDQCGVELIPFSRDEEDWRQLIHVLAAFVDKLPRNDPMTVEDFRDMEALINA